ncbi:hypothetical protein [Zavarzinia compransoris]|uniref:Tip attachment protein J domain-containing protein n=1 Tax=Zavarzinia compransoris TaxID=1264899 RepID=A0A317EB06_9PROT|nr:hypothetical protein [Zavarzinia compransoris]PWR23350.1 hypothetical protein DKG75_01930 [Zavarzinia compransoris]TDP46076.1 hypothetical protein DES42_104159 [Zavarzinia compransoris]
MTRLRAIVAEIAVTPAGGSPEVLRVSDSPIRPWSPADPARPNASARELLVEVGEISTELYADLSRLASTVGGGEIVLSATGGALAAYAGATWGDVAIYWGDTAIDGTPAPWATWSRLMSGRVEAVRQDLSVTGPSRLRLLCYDPRGTLDEAVQGRTYLGTNSGAAGYEGTSDDLIGKAVPIALGDLTRANISPPCVNTARQVYQLNDGGDYSDEILRVGGGDAGATMAGDLSSADFDASMAPASGAYVRDRARGLVMLGGGIISAALSATLKGAVGGAYVATAPGLIKRLLERRGTPAGQIGGTFGAVSAPAPVGLWIEGATSYRSVIETLAASMGGWVAPDSVGVWQIGLLAAPAGAPAETLDSYSIRDLAVDDADDAIPAWRVTVRHARNYTVMRRSDLAGAVRETDRAAELAREWREAVWSAPAVKAAYPAARDLVLDTALVAQADAQALADRLGGLLGQPRRSWRVTVELTAARLAYQPGITCLALDYRPLAIGGLYRVMGRKLFSPSRHLMTLRLWG